MKTFHDLNPNQDPQMWGPDGKLRGLGNLVIQVFSHELRRLVELPPDVEIVRTLPPPAVSQYHVDWIDDPRQLSYVHIRHRFAPRTRPGDVLMYQSLESFLKQYVELTNKEAENARQIVELNGTRS